MAGETQQLEAQAMAQADEHSRMAHFAGGLGADGAVAETHVATSIPQPPAAPHDMASNTSVETVPNRIKSINGVDDRTFLTSMFPQASKVSPVTKASAAMEKQVNQQ